MCGRQVLARQEPDDGTMIVLKRNVVVPADFRLVNAWFVTLRRHDGGGRRRDEFEGLESRHVGEPARCCSDIPMLVIHSHHDSRYPAAVLMARPRIYVVSVPIMTDAVREQLYDIWTCFIPRKHTYNH